MKQVYDHTDNSPENGKRGEGFFREVEAPYRKSREQAWAEIEAAIERKPAGKAVAFRPYRLSIAIAATLLLLAGVFSLIRFYTKTVECPAGQHLAFVLPDGSSVKLNAESAISFHPYWWRFDRQLRFEGEGFFEVQKGKTFSVNSIMGTTQVLGTSFNIFARTNEYKVACMTGQVRVISNTSEQVVLTPDYKAEIGIDGTIMVTKETVAENMTWTHNMFYFTSRPLIKVLEEIERQYGIDISIESIPDYIYTGYFSRKHQADEVLALVCKPFGLTFVKISEKKYKIIQNQDN